MADMTITRMIKLFDEYEEAKKYYKYYYEMLELDYDLLDAKDDKVLIERLYQLINIELNKLKYLKKILNFIMTKLYAINKKICKKYDFIKKVDFRKNSLMQQSYVYFHFDYQTRTLYDMYMKRKYKDIDKFFKNCSFMHYTKNISLTPIPYYNFFVKEEYNGYKRNRKKIIRNARRNKNNQ